MAPSDWSGPGDHVEEQPGSVWDRVDALASTPLASGRHNLYAEACGRWVHEAGRVALIVRDELGRRTTLTYRALDDQSARLAGFLAETLGVRAGDRVAGALDRGATPWLVAFAAWRLGAVYVPLFVGYGATALADRLRIAGARVVVAEATLRNVLGEAAPLVGHDLEVLFTGSGGNAHDGIGLGRALAHPPRRQLAATRPGDPAVLMFTSGTSGPPKACVVSHAGWLATVPFVQYVLAPRDGDAVLVTSDPGWSYGLLTTGAAVMALGHSVLVQTGRFEPDCLLDALAEPGVTHVAGAPTAFRRLVERLPKRARPSFLRTATCGGEALDAETAEAWRQLTGVPLRDGYGLTEVGMVLANRGARDGGLTPIPGWEVRLVDPDDPGVRATEGRLLVRRPRHQLSCGYLGASDQWARRWVQDEWFATEDLFRQDGEGVLVYRGRVDDVIVTSGYNVSAVEVESVIRQHPDVRDVAAIAAPDGARGSVVRAVVQPRDGAAGTVELARQVQDLVRREVGRHAYPRLVDFTDDLPRTESGKVRRQALRGAAWTAPAATMPGPAQAEEGTP